MKRQAKGFSGMITFYVKGDKSNVQKFFDAVKVCVYIVCLSVVFSSKINKAHNRHGPVAYRVSHMICIHTGCYRGWERGG